MLQVRLPLLLFPATRALGALLLASTACDPSRAAESDGEVDPGVSTAFEVVEHSRDDELRKAVAALRDGRPWDATQRLLPRVRDERAASASPEVAIVAAQAAAAWGGRAEAARILAAAPWRGSAFSGEGHELLARLALDGNDAARAIVHADSARRAPGGETARGVRTVLLARALDRAARRDSAAAAYTRAAKLIPEASDWLLLRAAGVERDARARARLYDDVRSPLARGRIAWTEALALEQAGELTGAARLYDSLQARPQALRLRVAAARADTALLATMRPVAFETLERARSADEWRRTIVIVDSTFAPITPAEHLRIARSSTRRGTAARTVDGYRRAAADGVTLTDQDSYDYATALTQLGRWKDAADRYARVSGTSSLAGRAAYQRARALLRAGDVGAARTALRAVVSRHGNDAWAASSALYLLADLATDEGRDAAARSAWRELVTKYPNSARADEAAFRAAMIAYIAGDARTAANEWTAAARRWPNAAEAVPSRYWAGRAYARLGDRAAAQAQWREVMQQSPVSYYAVLASRRLDVAPWTPSAADDTPPRVAAVDSGIARIRMLDSLGMDVEVGHERDALLAAGAAFLELGQSSRAISLGLKALAAGAPRDARTYRLVYPLMHRDALIAAARQTRLDPTLVAALVRQESSFNPRAISPVGARGLMQLMPPVGRSIARGKDYPLWDDALLLQPTVSFDLGTTHLAGDLRRHDDLTRALAAYNAGASRVTRWAKKAGVTDPEVFAERIPYVETRDYVRIVQRNIVMYRALYDWGK